MYAFNSAAIFYPGHPYIESTTYSLIRLQRNRRTEYIRVREVTHDKHNTCLTNNIVIVYELEC